MVLFGLFLQHILLQIKQKYREQLRMREHSSTAQGSGLVLIFTAQAVVRQLSWLQAAALPLNGWDPLSVILSACEMKEPIPWIFKL